MILPSSAVAWFSLPWIPCSFYVLANSRSHFDHIVSAIHSLAGVSGFYAEVLQPKWPDHLCLPSVEPSRPPVRIPPVDFGWVKINNDAENVYRGDYGFIAFRSRSGTSALVVLVPRVCKTCELWANRGQYCATCLVSRPDAQPWRFPLPVQYAHLRYDTATLRGFVFGLVVECMPSEYLEPICAIPDFVYATFRDHLESTNHTNFVDHGYRSFGIPISLPPPRDFQSMFTAGEVVYLPWDADLYLVETDDDDAPGEVKTNYIPLRNWFRVAGCEGVGYDVSYVLLSNDPIGDFQQRVDELSRERADEMAFDLLQKPSGHSVHFPRREPAENVRKLINVGDRCSCPYIGLEEDGLFELVQVFSDGVVTVKRDGTLYTVPNSNFLSSQEMHATFPRVAFQKAISSRNLELWIPTKTWHEGRSAVPRCKSWTNLRVKIHSSPVPRRSDLNRVHFGKYGVVTDYRWVAPESEILDSWSELYPSNIKVTVTLDTVPTQSHGTIVCDMLGLRVEDANGFAF